MDYDEAHTHSTNAANELEGLQCTAFWLELPADVQRDLSKAHAILRTMAGTMEATGLA